MDEQLELINQIEKEFIEIVRKAFPTSFLRRWGSSGPAFNASFAKENLFFQDTDYYYKDNLSFFHLTSISNLFSIINSRTLRLYNLHNSNDPDEYEYSARVLNPTLKQIKYRKDNIYTFSFCPVSEINNDHLWNLYGDKFKGVAIVFDIINDPRKWNNFHMSKIQYNLSADVGNYVREIADLKIKYPGCSFYLDIEKILAFHKMEKWKEENEIRILTYYPYEFDDERAKYIKRELKIGPDRNRFTEYIDLYLSVNNESSYLRNQSSNTLLDRRQILPTDDYFVTKPQLIIKNIIFGYNCGLTNPEYLKFKYDIEAMIRSNFGYAVEMPLNLVKPT